MATRRDIEIALAAIRFADRATKRGITPAQAAVEQQRRRAAKLEKIRERTRNSSAPR